MMTEAARTLVRLGFVMLILALLARLAGLSRANLVGDDLALLTSLGVIVFGAAYLRFGRH